MDEDELRMRARVVYDGAPLKQLRDDLRNAGRGPGARDMERDWTNIKRRISAATNELKVGFAPVLRGVGITSLGVGTGLAGLMLGLKSSATAGRNLKFFADQLQVSVRDLRELIALGEHFDIPQQATESALKGFANNLNMIKKHWGEVYNSLRAMNLGNIAEDMINAPTLKDAFDKALEDLQKIPDPVYRRKVAEMLLGSDQWAVVATEQTRKIRKQIVDDLGKLPPGFLKDSEAFVDGLKSIERELGVLKTQFFGPLLPDVVEFLKMLRGDGDAGQSWLGREVKSLSQALDDIIVDLTLIGKGNWKGLYNHMFGQEGRAQTEQLAGKKQELSMMDKVLSDIESGKQPSSKEQTQAIRQRREELVREIQKLTKQLEETNKNNLLQKQSFTGMPGAMPRIIPASFGGGYAMPKSGGGAGGMPGPGASGPSGSRARDRRAIAKIMADEMRRAGMSEAAIAGIFANVEDESRFNPTLRHFDQPRYRGTEAENAHGLFQEGGAEWNRYAAWLKKYHPDANWRDPALQTRFLMENLKKNYPKLWERMQGAKSPEEAAELFIRGYLKPRQDYMAGRVRKYRRGVPGAEHYTGKDDPSPRVTPAPPAVQQEIRGRASIDINFSNMPTGTRVRSSTDGMFRDVNISRGRPMQSVWDI